jgi:hypothetical protein
VIRDKNISLEPFGRLIASFPIGMRGKFLYWACLCSCGNTTVATIYQLLKGLKLSCGCIQHEMLLARNQSKAQRAAASRHLTELHRDPNFKPRLKHGHGSKQAGVSPTYVSWSDLWDRCLNPKSSAWQWYGGANPPVLICERWRGEHGFENFLSDMGERPEGTTLGRFGDVGNYEPGNCAWQTWKEQGAEKRKHYALLPAGHKFMKRKQAA